jgi:hypothetical protein
MRDFMNIVEGMSVRLGDLISAKVGDPNADFWIIRRGGADTVGEPTREFAPERIGIRVTATDMLDSRYLYYMLEHIWRSGYFKQKATGATNLVNIRVADVLNLPVG